ncbi:MAG: Sulphatase-modifying factor protein [Bacteroidota bacterium]|nr:Sulphatase-modifying factor protein [Bacteroidota bacterium]
MKKFALFTLTAVFLSLSVFAQKKDKPKSKAAPIDLNKYILVEGGTYSMGTDKMVETHEGPPHTVTVKGFYLAKTETTYEDYDKFCFETKYDTAGGAGWGRGKQPIVNVTWLEAVKYCNWLSAKEKLSKCYLINDTTKEVKYLDTAKGYRLPTEAEWEYAARGGNKSKNTLHAGGNDLSTVGWFAGNSGNRAMPVAQKAPNELGFYDMTGNVWEWCWDVYDWNYYKVSPAEDPKGPATGSYRVMRGGAFYNQPNYTHIVTRQNAGIGFKQNSVGFRVARTYYE